MVNSNNLEKMLKDCYGEMLISRELYNPSLDIHDQFTGELTRVIAIKLDDDNETMIWELEDHYIAVERCFKNDGDLHYLTKIQNRDDLINELKKHVWHTLEYYLKIIDYYKKNPIYFLDF